MSKKLLISLLILLLSFSGCSTFKQWQDLPRSKADEKHFYVNSNGWHTGIIIPSSYLDKRFNFLTSYFGYGKYFEFGWGDAGYYPATDGHFSLGLKALFWPTPTVMHVVALPVKPEKYFIAPNIIKVTIATKRIKMLLDYLYESFQKDSSGKTTTLQKGLYGRSLFFKATGSFFITRTCNTWTSQALEEAGLPVNSFLTLTADSVISQTENALEKYPH